MDGIEAKGRAESARYLDETEARLLELSIESSRADWVHATYVTPDTEALSSRAYGRLIGETVARARAANALPAGSLSPEMARKVRMLRVSLPLIAPADRAASEELTGTVAWMQSVYARGSYAPSGSGEPIDLQGLSRLLTEVREPNRLADVWQGWHGVARPMRPRFERYVALANAGSREIGFPDTGAMWRSRYDMEPSEFADDVARVWRDLEPLYRALHAFVRARLREHYGPEVVPADGPIPVHLLGNMWGQTWEHLLPLVGRGTSAPAYDLTATLRARATTPLDMVRYAERFFVSLGFETLPATFWERSMFAKPSDREVVCHASAWDLDFVDDVRLKMCIETTEEEFHVIHHELGHNYYQLAYRTQPFLFRDSANDGFHEAVGDTIALSVTPEYLSRIGLLERTAPPGQDLGLLLRTALEKLAFVPFGYLVDLWRWKVFSGEIEPSEYNASWWALRERYQGIAPPAARSEADFDPGAKYHVAANVPYMRYFLAHVLQFQFHRALARIVDAKGPLHRCSIYGNAEAGARLRSMLAMGASRPWPDALEELTGERRLDATAVVDYFRPLLEWLERENRDQPVGW